MLARNECVKKNEQMEISYSLVYEASLWVSAREKLSNQSCIGLIESDGSNNWDSSDNKHSMSLFVKSALFKYINMSPIPLSPAVIEL